MIHEGPNAVQVLLRRIYRERRRLFIFAGSAIVSGYLWFQNDGPGWLGVPVSVWVALLVGVGLTIPAGLLALLAPEWRYSLETVGIALFFYSVVMVQVPQYSFVGGHAGLAPFVFFLIAANFVHVVMYGDWSERLLKLRRHSERGVAHTRIRRQEAWSLVLPSPEQTAYWDGTVSSVNRIEGTPGQPGDLLLVSHLFPDGKTLAQQIRLKEVSPGKSLRYAYAVPAATNGSEREQSCALLLEERGSDLTIHARWDRVDYPIRRAVMHWIDDWAGRSLDTIILRVEVMAHAQREEAAKVAPLVRPKDRRSGA